ncbi:hypothetical protein VM1G_08351 [Cytospora mali]|uniref:Plus3 domain-containing protein n=1 Tax=Cytospora mali TaxID=578113 RepID=A0A194W917_CYTMA|nr:hypothetical protein VM1G_08351 [Valsa mali]
MSDFGDPDDMLLALAGGGDGSSDDEASNAGSRRRSRSRSSRSRSHRRSQSAHSAGGSPQRSATAKKSQTQKSQGRARAESEDEGEASDPGTPRSQSSVPMDESDSDDESDDGHNKEATDDENQYPVEGLFKSYAEKDEIMAMREVDREMILDERQQEKDRLRRLAMLKQMVQNTEQGEKQKKRKAGTADLEDGQRKTSRPRTTKPLPSALDSLKRARAEKEDRRRHREERSRHGRSPSYRSRSSRSRSRLSDDSDVEWAASSKKRRSRTPEPALPAELRDIERCRLSRTRFGKLCFWPGAEQALTGCYIRISIGPDPNTRQPVYRMAVIKGFTTGRPYAVENDQRKTIVTDQYVIGAHGKAQKEWPFIACSESPFTDAEWNRYQIVCKNDGITLPKKPELMQKVEDINNLLSRSWTDEELSEKLKRQNALRDRFSGAERANIEREIAEARRHGNEELANELQENLDSMPAPRLAFQTTLKKASPTKPSGPTQQDRLAEKNRINRQLNSKLVREAQLAERRKVREIEEALARGEEVAGDMSRRVKTKVKFLHKAEDEAKGFVPRNASGASTPANGTPKLGAQKTLKDELPHMAKLREQAAATGKGGIPKIHQALTDDDVIGALDLDIDDEI